VELELDTLLCRTLVPFELLEAERVEVALDGS